MLSLFSSSFSFSSNNNSNSKSGSDSNPEDEDGPFIILLSSTNVERPINTLLKYLRPNELPDYIKLLNFIFSKKRKNTYNNSSNSLPNSSKSFNSFSALNNYIPYIPAYKLPKLRIEEEREKVREEFLIRNLKRK